MKKLIKVGLILTGALSLFLISGCSGEKGLDISNCIDDTVTGFNGEAKFEGKVYYDKLVQIPMFQNKLTEDMLSGDYKVKLVADKTTDLKNGDKIKLSLDYNKEIYKRDFGVELTFEPKEIEVEKLKNLIKKESDLNSEQWMQLDENINNVANKYFKDNGDTNTKLLCKIISLDKKYNSNRISYWYEAMSSKGRKIYLDVYYNNNYTEENESSIRFSSSRDWTYINMNKGFKGIIDRFYGNNGDMEYVIIEK